MQNDYQKTNRLPRDLFLLASIVVGVLAVTTLCAAENPNEQDGGEPTAAQTEFFEKKIRPLLVDRCHKCHSTSAKKLQANLLLDSRKGIMDGGDTGPAIVSGSADESPLIRAVRYESSEMPPDGKLPDAQIAALTEWVNMGAPWPREVTTNVKQESDPYDWEQLRGSHWAWQSVVKPPLPDVQNAQWPLNAIDRFVLARLEAAELQPAEPAGRRDVIRRAYFELIGLPPSPQDIEAFLHDDSADAFAKVVDRLLASPQHGERWGRHWLDVARYSDGFGGFLDKDPLPEAWRYRDWVVRAFNRDLPYDEFVRQQIAGDLINVDDSVLGPGFFAIGPLYRSDGGDPDSVAQAKSETLDDRIDTFSRAFLGLTVSCARCHDHKFDPIPTQDYYSLAGVFNNTSRVDKPGHTLAEAGSADMHVALRGNLLKPGPVAPRRFLRILSGPDPPHFSQGSGRAELAECVVSRDNPLTARVIVNRIWLQHFGQGLVRTPSNFGTLGGQPTHPQLLDWLAARFVESGWSIKELHRTIMLSATYQMSSDFDEHNFSVDGDNRLIWRMNPRRLDVESWRDALLRVTDKLDTTIGGSPTDKIDSRRRTLYLKISRNGDEFATDTLLQLFDFPLPRATNAQRVNSTVPQQFLFLMNSPLIIDRAKALAARLNQCAESDAERIELAYMLLYGRPPISEETDFGLQFLAQANEGDNNNRLTNWQQYAQVLLSANEFMYVR